MKFSEIAVDLLMYPANRHFTKADFYPSVFGALADFVFPYPDTALGRLLEPESNALVHHRARSPHSDATVAKGKMRGEEALVVVIAALSKPPAWLFYIVLAGDLTQSAD